MFYLDKAKATALYRGSKVTVPKMPNTSDGFVSSIRDVNSPVKLKIKDVTESRQFKRWFGNSKVVNADGSPKIVYHQTENDFTVFDTRREGAGTRDDGTPFGIFLKSSDRDIGLKGKKQMALYARIVKPLRARDRSELTRLMRNMSPEYDALITQHEALDRKSKVKQEAVVLADELITTAQHRGDHAARHPHGWLDDNGRKDWPEWKTYIQDKENTVWEATLHVATSANGEKILYDIDPIKKTGQSGNSDTSTAEHIVAERTGDVKSQYSIDDDLPINSQLVLNGSFEKRNNEVHIRTETASRPTRQSRFTRRAMQARRYRKR